MLSHLRFHRRGPSNPTSPLPDQTSPTSWESAAANEYAQPIRGASPRPGTGPSSPTSSQMPPSLPPITRVTSPEPDSTFFPQSDDPPQAPRPHSPSNSPWIDPKNNDIMDRPFVGGVVWRNYQRDLNTHPDGRVSNHAPQTPAVRESHISRAKPPPPPIITSPFAAKPSSQPVSSFATPTDLQQIPMSTNGQPPPQGTQVASGPPNLPPGASKSRKGLPFLKNPVSTLLLRRKSAQNAVQLRAQLALGSRAADPAYDPRIRGTRVHDFSAPRPRKSNPSEGPVHTKKAPSADSTTTLVEQVPEDSKEVSLDKPLPKQPPLSDSPDRRASPSPRAIPSPPTSSFAANVPPLVKAAASTTSTRTSKSRTVSFSGISTRDSTLSAIPKHMKSTSSRFSFDMIGAAKQEKLLEERHRQRELERKTTDVGFDGQRDSRYDEFDDDGFDYDAMMDDDGLEERIPGVNADADEDLYDELEAHLDPDNDQKNFAGFTFQRSNNHSTSTSPLAPRPLSLPGNNVVAGPTIAEPLSSDSSAPPKAEDSQQDSADPVAGLGIRGLYADSQPANDTVASENERQPRPTSAPKLPPIGDDLYFDDGLADELDFEHEGPAFDESIFDLNDTDQYGRPIPGAFAKAQSEMTAKREAAKRESDQTSADISRLSAISASTAHTSLSAAPPPLVPAPEGPVQDPTPAPQEDEKEPLDTSAPVADQDIVYQAALAEAAQMAAASGKFRRGSSPAPPADLTVTSPTDSEPYSQAAENPLWGYEDDDPGLAQNLDDFDLDDDAIIAEANATALANDYDGFYGQEFGFYSAPVNQPPSHNYAPSASSSGQAKVLNAENLYQYANGGFFGPGGSLDRSASARVVSREPNLTPITERSEYSNRNSIMSLNLPASVTNGGPHSASMQSPGLAQLAMMADDDNISLSALIRLRSRAWGGSQASPASSREGSPQSERGDLPADGIGSPLGMQSCASPPNHLASGYSVKNSNFSAWNGSDAGSSSGSPTLTMSMPPPLPSSPPQTTSFMSGGPLPHMLSPPQTATQQLHDPSPGISPISCPPVPEADETMLYEDCISPIESRQATTSGRYSWNKCPGMLDEPDSALFASPASSPAIASFSPLSQGQCSKQPGVKGHRHKGSADSVSYVKEEEEGGETRWVMERRRTGESGEVEILEREVVEGGRI